MMKRKLTVGVLIGLLLAALAFTSTRLAVDQLLIPNFAEVRLWAISGAGLVFVGLDPATLRLDTSGPAPTLKVIMPASTTTELQVFCVPNPPSVVFVLESTPVGVVGVYRNGVRMAPGVDYEVEGKTVRMLPIQGVVAGDIVLVEYRR